MKVLTKDKRAVVVIDIAEDGSSFHSEELTQEDVDYIASSYLSGQWAVVLKTSLDSSVSDKNA